MIELVPIKEPEKIWGLVKDNIEKVLLRFPDDGILEDIYKDLLSRDRQLWVVLKNGEVVASVLTLINEYHGKRYGVLTHAGGQGAEEWFHIVNPIGEFFKSEGCHKFIIHGRKGWAKFLTDFRSDKIIFERSLDE